MALWYAARVSGMVSIILLSAVMVLGLLVAGRRRPLYVLTGVHRSLSLLAVAFVAAHVGTIVLDDYVPIGWTDVIVPFASSYQALWTGLGTVTLDLLVVLIVTSLLRHRIGLRGWRAVHWLAYACWPIALVHGIGAGTDDTLVLVLTAGGVLAVGTALAVRLRHLQQTGDRRTPPAPPATPPAPPAASTGDPLARTGGSR